VLAEVWTKQGRHMAALLMLHRGAAGLAASRTGLSR